MCEYNVNDLGQTGPVTMEHQVKDTCLFVGGRGLLFESRIFLLRSSPTNQKWDDVRLANDLSTIPGFQFGYLFHHSFSGCVLIKTHLALINYPLNFSSTLHTIPQYPVPGLLCMLLVESVITR